MREGIAPAKRAKRRRALPSICARGRSPELQRKGRGLILLVCLAILLARAFVQLFRVVGNSMHPTLSEGEVVVVRKRWIQSRRLRRGQVVLVERPQEPGRPVLKRVIGLPLESVLAHEGWVFIDGHALHEPYVLVREMDSWGPVRLAANEYLVLGDNRLRSTDSRTWGNVDEQEIIGVAFAPRGKRPREQAAELERRSSYSQPRYSRSSHQSCVSDDRSPGAL
jgi:signal peptidase I